MDNLIKEIMSNLENKNYLSALALTLILPDICGEIEYPKIKSGRERYAKWYNKHIYQFEIPEGMEELHKFNGDAVYQLRCNLLHDGSSDISEHMKEKHSPKESENFVFELTDTTTSFGKTWELEEDDHILVIKIGVDAFCRKVCSTAGKYYKDKEQPDIFNKIIISDDIKISFRELNGK
ncbi:hypothetical protein [Bacillus cereus]|uniref:hypothetical protein n=1 Tax=Bacillus cereus TaxID=1396 RepID=UPI00240D8C13|nr:hypothetical protein [Bacillus cereus]MDG1567624.1 hypothetical protein [Bacillus cereus]